VSRRRGSRAGLLGRIAWTLSLARTASRLRGMHRRWWERSFAALFALWFAIAVVEPGPLRSCPMHSGLALGTASRTASAADTSEHARHESSSPHSPAHHGGAHNCTCLGDCASGSPGAALPSAASVHLHAVIERVVVHVPTQSRFVPRAAEHVLPFANGPPSATHLA
jgi:hypothetical protein